MRNPESCLAPSRQCRFWHAEPANSAFNPSAAADRENRAYPMAANRPFVGYHDLGFANVPEILA